MKHIFLIIFAIILFGVGSNSKVFAQEVSLKKEQIRLTENTISIDNHRNNSTETINRQTSKHKQNNSRSHDVNEYVLEDFENKTSSFELKFFLFMVTLVVFLAILNLYGDKGKVREFQQFD